MKRIHTKIWSVLLSIALVLITVLNGSLGILKANAADLDANLLTNPGGEIYGTDGMLSSNGWSTDGTCHAYSYPASGTFTPHTGTYFMGYYNSNGSWFQYSWNDCYQTVDVSSQSAGIDGGSLIVQLGGYLRVSSGNTATLELVELDNSGTAISTTAIQQSSTSQSWEQARLSEAMVPGARYLQVRLAGNLPSTGYAGFDDLSLTLSASSDQAPAITSVADQAIVVGNSISPLSFAVTDADTVVNDLTVTAASSNTTLIPNSSDSLQLSHAYNSGAYSLTVVPASAQAGQSTVTLTVSDGIKFTQTSFIVTVSPDAQIGSNLVVNGDASSGSLAGWTDPESRFYIDSGVLTVTLPDGMSSYSMYQDINITKYSAMIDAGLLTYTSSCFCNYGGEFTLQFLDASDNVLTAGSASGTIPSGTRTARVTVGGPSGLVIDDVNFTISGAGLPAASAVPDQTLMAGSGTGALPFVVGYVGSSATVTAASSDQMVIPDGNITVGGSGYQRTVAVTAPVDAGGTSTITLKVNGTAVQSFDVTVESHADVTLSASPESGFAEYGDSVTLTAQVSPQNGGRIPTGIVTFLDNGNPIAGDASDVPLSSSGSAQYVWSSGAVGTHNLSVVYSGDSYYNTASGLLSYSIAPCSDAALSTLSISSGSLDKVFDAGTFTYSASVPYGTSSITVTPTADSPFASIAVNGTTVASGGASGDIALAVGTSSVTVTVTAQNGTLQPYIITVTRAASSDVSLSGLSLSAGTLTQSSSDPTQYTASVPNSASEVTVSATASDANAYVAIGSGPAAPATASDTVSLTAGGQTEIDITVTAQDNSSQTYKIFVTRAASTNIPVGSITVTGAGDASSVTNGDTLQISAVASPSDATNRNVTWSVANGTGSATIDSSTGLLTATGVGTVTVTATAQDGSGVSGSLVVTVTAAAPTTISVRSITVTGAGGVTSLMNGGTLQTNTTASPSDATNQNVMWSVANGTGSATIDSSAGLLTATGVGTVTVTATAQDGSGVSGSLVVTVTAAIPVSSITVTGAGGATSVVSGGTLQMSVAASPSDATNQSVTWSMANGTGSAAISTSGLLTATGVGTVTVIATARDGSNVYGSLVVTITSASSGSSGGGGSSSTTPRPVTVTGTTTTNGTGTFSTAATIPASDTNISMVSTVTAHLGNISVQAPASVLNSALGGDTTASLSLSQSASPASTQQSAFHLTTANGDTPVAALDLNLTRVAADGTQTAVHTLSGDVTVTITLTAAQIAAIVSGTPDVYYYDTSVSPAALTDMHATYDAAKGSLTFTMDHFSTYVVTTGTVAVSIAPGVSYTAHVQNIDWQKSVADGAEAGTEHRSLRMEAVQIKLTGTLPTGASIVYQAHVQRYGWMSSASDNAVGGTTGRGLRLEALRITLQGLSGYAVKYRAYVQNKGWLDWVSTTNGTDISKAAISGTIGKGLRMEAIEIEIIKI